MSNNGQRDDQKGIHVTGMEENNIRAMKKV